MLTKPRPIKRSPSTMTLARQVMAGLPYRSLVRLRQKIGLPLSLLAKTLRIPPRTLARRAISGRFTVDESERVLRLSTLCEKAIELFEGDAAGAANWLLSPAIALGDVAPLELAATEVGVRDVENLIGRLEYGVYT